MQLHSLKGVAMQIGAHELSSHVKDLEIKLKEMTIDNHFLNELCSHIDYICLEFEAMFQET